MLLMLLMLLVIGVSAIVGLGALVLWLWTLIDCIQHETDRDNQRLIWILLIVFLHLLGAILYLVIRRPQRLREQAPARPA